MVWRVFHSQPSSELTVQQKRKHSNKHITVNSKVILNRSKNGHKVRKTVQTQRINYSKVDAALFII